MKRSYLVLIVALLSFCVAAATARAETLFFIPQQTQSWNDVANWFVAGPNNTFTLAGRLPQSADDAQLKGNCNAVSVSPQLMSLTVEALVTLTGGDFDVGAVNFAVPKAGTGSNGMTGTRLTVRTAMNFTIANTGLANCQIIMQGGSSASQGSNVTISGTTIFNQGSWVLQPGASLTFLGSSNRFDNIGDLRGNGGTTQLSAGFQNLTFNNSGTIRADSGTLVINGNIIWTNEDAQRDGSFYPVTDDAVINITGAFVVPANTITYFKGPGVVQTAGSVTINGTLQVGVPASGAMRDQIVIQADASPREISLWAVLADVHGGGVVDVTGDGDMRVRTATIQVDFTGIINVLNGGALNIVGANNNGTGTVTMLGGAVIAQEGAEINFNVREFDTRNTTFNILAGATVNTLSPLGIVSTGAPAPVFNNFGTWNGIAGTSSNPPAGFSGITTNAPILNNDGTLNITGTGTFQISGGASSGGSFNYAPDLAFVNRLYSADSFTRFLGPGALVLAEAGGLNNPLGVGGMSMLLFHLRIENGGVLDGPGAFTVQDQFDWRGGAIQGSGMLIFGPESNAVIQGSFAKTLQQRTINNSGIATWTGTGSIQASEGATWNNLTGSTFDVQSNALFDGTLENTPNFNNLTGGTFKKSAGTGTSTIGINFNNSGLVELQSGATRFYKFIQLSGGSTNLSGGNLTMLGFPMNLDGGNLLGNGTITGHCMNHGATIAPGQSPGKITINGDFTQDAGGTLRIEVAGLTTPGVDFDQLVVTGTATLGGTLHISDINGFTPSGTDTVPALTANAITGAFDFINSQTTYNSTTVVAAAKPVPLASLLNISTRLQVGTDDNVLIGGFIITGSSNKKVIIRALGPSLQSNGTPVPGRLANPTLELRNQAGTLLTSNNNWKSTQQAEIEASTIPPSHDLESAIVATLEPGNYTAIIRGVNNATGIALAEVYDLTPAVASKLANISTRGFVQKGDDVMIGGFIIGNQTSKVIVRALGPSLPVPGKLADPILELRDSQGALLDLNDNWHSDQEAEIEATTIPPSDDFESAIVRSLAPGNYTAIVRGARDSTGVALVEIFNLR